MAYTIDEILQLPYVLSTKGHALCRIGGVYIRRSHLVVEADGRAARPGQVVHHKDENKANDHPDNLEVLWPGAHVKLHKIGNTYFKGRKHTEETKRKMSLAAMGNTRGAGQVWTDERRRNASEFRKTFRYSEESKRKMSESAKNRKDRGRCEVCGRFGTHEHKV